MKSYNEAKEMYKSGKNLKEVAAALMGEEKQ